jgi:hypothetical protein
MSKVIHQIMHPSLPIAINGSNDVSQNEQEHAKSHPVEAVFGMRKPHLTGQTAIFKTAVISNIISISKLTKISNKLH